MDTASDQSAAVQKPLNLLVERLRNACGDRLVSVILYGSAVTDDRQAKFSDLNILCVLSEIGTRELAAAEDIFRWWRERGSPAPLLLTEGEIANSTDCFTIEFIDIKTNRRVLHGKDVVADLEIDTSFYRAQVERDLRAKLLRLRQKAVGMFSDPDLLRRLLLDSLSTFCVLFRHALALHGVDAPARKRDIVILGGRHFGIDPAPFELLLDVREERRKPREVEPVGVLSACLRGISMVADAVDRLGETPRQQDQQGR